MRENGSHTPSEWPRRSVLLGLLAAGGIALSPTRAAAGAARLDETDTSHTATADPHTTATFQAFVDAMVPETPALGDDRGGEHEPGALAIDLEAFLVYAFNSYFPTTPATSDHNARAASAVATLLDAAASELIARGENEDPPDPTRFPAGGTFASLAREDRFRAIDRLERQDYTLDMPQGESDALERLTEYPGAVDFAMIGLNSFAVVGYYTEWAGYGETKTATPTERTFTGDVQSWTQTDYPGPAWGYAALRGYEVEEFREGDY